MAQPQKEKGERSPQLLDRGACAEQDQEKQVRPGSGPGDTNVWALSRLHMHVLVSVQGYIRCRSRKEAAKAASEQDRLSLLCDR